jgi:hypothetical protein
MCVWSENQHWLLHIQVRKYAKEYLTQDIDRNQVLEWAVNLTVIWHCLIDACELTHILCIQKEMQQLWWKY